ncbi:MAG: alpha-amylase family protein [Flavipsychrobacter sp.]
MKHIYISLSSAFAFILIAACNFEIGENKLHQRFVPADSVNVEWYKDAIIYNVDVKVYKDANNDGIGDFKGLMQKLDYLDSLGVSVIWLSPVMPSPWQDDGYDITDYYSIDKRLGTMHDFNEFIKEAHAHHFKIIMDLVVNHTSDKHPWFQAGRRTSSPYHSWYVWSKKRPANYKKGMVFPGVQKEIWTYDSVAGEYYYHRFYKFQPDLNMQNPAVFAEVKKIITFWATKGVSGFRLDGVPFLIEVPQKTGRHFDEQFEKLTQLHSLLDSFIKFPVLLGETNILPKDNIRYFGTKGQELNVMFNFYVNQYLFYALASGNKESLQNAVEETADIPKSAAWAQFLRNHDELDLGRLSNHDRETVYKAFGPEKYMQLYDRGIRRRIAPMLQSMKRLQLAYSLLFSLPSIPVIRYGEEIGMGDNLSLPERLSVRTPMQWSDSLNAGFSQHTTTIRPIINNGPYSYKQVNVVTEQHDTASLLHWLHKMIMLRRQCKEVSYGNWQIVQTGNKHVLAIYYSWNGRQLLVIHNFSDQAQRTKIKADYIFNYVLAGSASYTLNRNGTYTITLPGYGYCWLRIS